MVEFFLYGFFWNNLRLRSLPCVPWLMQTQLCSSWGLVFSLTSPMHLMVHFQDSFSEVLSLHCVSWVGLRTPFQHSPESMENTHVFLLPADSENAILSKMKLSIYYMCLFTILKQNQTSADPSRHTLNPDELWAVSLKALLSNGRLAGAFLPTFLPKGRGIVLTVELSRTNKQHSKTLPKFSLAIYYLSPLIFVKLSSFRFI